MSLGEILREKRRKLSLTQADVAKHLGVSTPAVNRWEKDLAFPEISLLSPLARLLKIDLNTLLSFEENLSREEIQIFFKELRDILDDEGFSTAFELAKKKIEEFPKSIDLLGIVIPFLDILLQITPIEDKKNYEEEFEKYYKELSESEQLQFKEIGISMYFFHLIKKNNFEKASEVLDLIPVIDIDKDLLKTHLLLSQDKREEAKVLILDRVRKSVLKTQQALLDLLDLAILNDDAEEVKRICKVYEDNIKAYNLPISFSLFLKLKLTLYEENDEECIEFLLQFLDYLKGPNMPSISFDYLLEGGDNPFNIIQSHIIEFQRINTLRPNTVIDGLVNDIKRELLHFI